jgi:hypothetical protein
MSRKGSAPPAENAPRSARCRYPTNGTRAHWNGPQPWGAKRKSPLWARAHGGLDPNIPGEKETAGVSGAVTFLRQVNLDDRTRPGDRLAAIDADRAARRLGAAKVGVVCRPSAVEIPA